MGQCLSTDAIAGSNGASSSTSKKGASATLKHRGSSVLHSNLVREQNIDFHEVYVVVDLIGEGSISNISKIRRRKIAIGGSSNPAFVDRHKTKKHSSSTTINSDVTSNNHQTEFWALKEIDLTFIKKEYIDELRNEVELLKSLDHPNIIKAYETFRVQKRLAIVMELCSGGDLYSRHPYTEAQAARIVRQVLSAVAYLHENCNIVHRDIKYENIMFENGEPDARVKLIDFGLARVYLDRKMTERCGTLYTMSPEVLRGEYTSKTDMWSIGVVTCMLISGEKPFWSKIQSELVSQIVSAQYSFRGEKWKNVSSEGKAFIRSLLMLRPEVRISASRALKHRWLSHNTNWSEEKPDLETWESAQSNLVRYADSPEFKKLALMVIAKKSTSREIFELRKIFDDIDKNNSGTITFEEFRKALSDLNYSDGDIKSMFDKMDMNRNGVIQYTEFLAATLEAQGRVDEYRIAEAFDQIDSDDTGYISKNNLRKILGKERSSDPVSSDDYIDKLINELDDNGDGIISYDEFRQAFAVAVDSNVKQMCERAESC